MNRFLLSCLFILFSSLASAQTWNELKNQVTELYKKGEYEKAIPIALKAIDIAKRDSGENHRSYASSLNKLALLYESTGQYENAEPLYLQTKEIYKKVFGADHLKYATNLNDLAILYERMKQYEKAEPLYIEVMEIDKKALGENHPDYATDLNNLAGLYKNKGQYGKAELLYIQAKEIYKKVFGENHVDYATSLNDLAILYERMKQYEKAEPLYIQTNEILRKVLGEDDTKYVTSLDNLASLYKNTGQYEKAEPLYLQTKEIYKKVFGENHPKYATNLNNLAILYERMKQYEKAEPLYIEVKELDKKALGEDHPDYATDLNNLAGLYRSKGQYDKAEHLYIQAKEIYKKVLGENHVDYATSLYNLANLYKRMAQYEKAEPLYLLAKEIRKKVLGENHPHYADVLNNLASLYEGMGQYEKVEPLYLLAKEIRKKILGENHPDYAASVNNIAYLYRRTNKYEKAEPLYLQAKEIYKKIVGENHPDYASVLNNLAFIYERMGQYEKAEPLYIKVKEIDLQILGENHPDYASDLNNLAALYVGMGQYEKSMSLFFRAKEIRKKILGEKHPAYAASLNNLASMHERMKQYEKAEPLYIEAKEIDKKALGENHPDYATDLNNLAALYESVGQYEKARPLYLQAKEIFKKVLGEYHPHYADVLNNLAGLYESLGQYEKAELLRILGTNIKLYNLRNTFTILSEKEKGNYLDNNISVIATNNSLLYNYRRSSSALLVNNFNLQLFFKSLSLADTRSMIESINKSPDRSIQELFKEWKSDKNLLAKQYSLPVSNRISNLDSIEARAEMIEKELTRKSSAFREQQKSININLKDVQKNLQPNEAAIEFVRFNLYNKKWTDSTMYAAYILRKNDSVPVFVPLCEEQQLQQLFASAGKTTSASVGAFYRGVEDETENISVSKGDSLYKLIWQPLKPYLQGIKKVSYSPAGKLYTIAFNALPTGDGKILMDKYELQQYTSTRQIALRSDNNKNTTPTSIALFGDATFTMDSLQLVKNERSITGFSTNMYLPQSRGSNAGTWSTLPGTAEEVKKIQQLFSQNKIATNTFTKTKASEESLKSLSGNAPQVLHIATHGFFLPEPDRKHTDAKEGNTYSLANDPLLRSGLILSGGNYAWGGKTPINGIEDGIATAYEISQLDLSKTELVVLSACETALGDIKGSEGVFGLQRSFKMAGVNKLIVSLWQVPDKETAELMTLFYADWLKGNTIENSFYKAQSEMRKKYSPFYWAAFVLVE